jgi:hypothetical protein
MLTPDGGTYHQHIKKDELGNETARFDVTTSTSQINTNEHYLEAWDLTKEISKKYQASLSKSFDDGSKLNKNKLYFIVMVKKDPESKQKIHIKIAITDKKLHKLYESTDLWSYDYVKGKATLLWSVPHKSAMMNYLKEPENYDKNLIKWINQFLDQSGFDIKAYDKKKIKIS